MTGPQLPPLGIGHLMLWTLGTALILAFGHPGASSKNAIGLILRSTFALSAALSAGGGIAYLILLPYYGFFRRLPVLKTGGHFLLLGIGIQAVLVLGYRYAFMIIGFLAGNLDSKLHFAGWAICYFAIGAAHLSFLIGIPKRGSWVFVVVFSSAKWMFTAVMYLAIYASAYQIQRIFSTPIHLLLTLIILALTVVGIIGDQARKEGQDWLSWWGKGAFLFSQIVGVGWAIYSLLR